MIKPWPHQIEKAKQGYSVLQKYGIVYYAMEERTGKTITALLTSEACLESINTILVITKKGKPEEGWQNTIDDMDLKKSYVITTFHQAHKCMFENYDLVIIDEAHNYISSFPKVPGGVQKKDKKASIYTALKRLCKDKPLIYLSATPHPQGYAMLYHQFALSSFSPWNTYKTYYAWWNNYGIPNPIWIHGRKVEKYDVVQDLVKGCCEHLFITGTRKELGFSQEPIDKVHYVKLDENTKAAYNQLITHKVIVEHEQLAALPCDTPIVCDTPMKLRVVLHQLEGGSLKHEDLNGNECLLQFNNREKIDYIKQAWGDTSDMVIFYHYRAEKVKLESAFKHAQILQGVTNAEGVDLSMYETVIIYSQNFSTGKHTQRRARQANMNRDTPIVVHFILVEGAVSDQVYDTVSLNKINFVDSVFEKVEL